MTSSRPLILTAALVFTGVVILSPLPDGRAQDAPPAETPAETPKEPAAAAVPEGPTDEQDAAARKILEAAAERQGGARLAPPDGSLDSFHITFHKVTLHRLITNADGTTKRQKIDSETPGLIVDWKGGQIRTEWYMSGERPVVRGVMHNGTKADGSVKEFSWLHDGTDVKSLSNKGYEKDLSEIQRDRKVVKALLDAAVLRRMLTDGSRWEIVEDAAFPGTALRRTPPKSAETPLRLTLWIDTATRDVVGARLAPNEAGESTMFYGFAYVDGIPEVKDEVLRFPARFRVMEQRDGETEPVDVMDAVAAKASFNDVADEAFRPPAAKSGR